MNLVAIAIIVLLALVVSALSSLFIYGLLWGVIWFVTSQFFASPYPFYITVSLSGIAFVSATISVIRKSTPPLHDLRWDSGAIEDAPSRISIPGEGGRLWNVNPLGGNSISSIGKICAAALCFPAGIFITLLRWGMHEIRNKK